MPQLTHRPVRVLVTGFGPFPGAHENPTTALAGCIGDATDWFPAGIILHTAVIPTVWEKAGPRLADLLDEFDPDIALHFGVYGGAGTIRVERAARNHASTHADAEGRRAAGPVLVPGGPRALSATLPTRHIAARLRAAGHAAKVSSDAGKYLCNALFYMSLHDAIVKDSERQTGFIHVPHPVSAGGRHRAGSGDMGQAPVSMLSLVDAAGIVIAGCVAEHRRATTPVHA